MGRAPCCDKANVKKGPWSPEEDAKLKSYIDQHGTGGNWIALPQKIGLKRCGKSCRLRWLNYLRPNIKHGGFSEEEDNIICSLYISIGSRWSIIAAQLPGRTDNDIKNYWNTRLKKKLLGKQRKGRQGHKGRSESAARGKPSSNNYPIPDHSFLIGQPPPPPVAAYGEMQPVQLPVLPPVPYSEAKFNDHASIRRLLIKLGGRFSEGTEEKINLGEFNKVDQQYPLMMNDGMLIQSNYNINSSTDLSCNSSQIPLINASPEMSCSLFPDGGALDLSNEVIERMMYENANLNPMFYQDVMINSCGNGSLNLDWGEIDSLAFAASCSSSQNGEGLLQGSTTTTAAAMAEVVGEKMMIRYDPGTTTQ